MRQSSQSSRTSLLSTEPARAIARTVIGLVAALLLAFGLPALRSLPAADSASTTLYLYVASYGNDQVLRYDARTGAFVDVFVRRGSGGLHGPVGMAFGPDGNLYVASSLSDQVLRYDGRTGAFIDIFVNGSTAYPVPGNYSLTRPEDLAFGPDGNLYVAFSGYTCMVRDVNGNYNRKPCGPTGIQRYNGATGAFINTFVSAGSGGLVYSNSITYGPDGNLYLNNSHGGASGEHAILRYDATTGAFLGTLVHDQNGGLWQAYNLTFGPDKNLYTLNRFCDSVERYNGTTGTHIDAFVEGRCAAHPYPPPGNGGLHNPSDLSFGPDGNLYVLSEGSNAVLRYNGATGDFVDTFVPSGRGGLNAPSSLLFHTGSAKKQGLPALVTVTQRASPNVAVRHGGTLTYSIIATNRDKGSATNVTITLPFDPQLFKVLDAQFSRPNAWVSEANKDTLVIQTGQIGSGDVVTATVRMVVLPAATKNTRLAQRLTYRWQDARGGGQGRGNAPIVVVADGDSTQSLYSLGVAPSSAAAGSTLVFQGDMFVPGEPVALWYNTPDGRSVALGRMTAGGEGVIRRPFDTAGLRAGYYSMVAYGLWSEFTATAPFEVR